MKLGSLFDGIGGFPLSAVRCGIEPVWASEIEPFPILTTYKRFPQMKHLGSVTDINGAEVEPVDILAFGSPCQDLSVAGKQAGIHDGERSNLFFEAVRIIKEMRANDETAGRPAELRRPRFAVWENVPGAFSSNKGADFQAVLQALAEVADPDVSVPLPAKGKWDKAGFILGDGYSIVWRTYDAQFWGVPQRRKRIYLVADFGGQRANEILFDPESVRGDPAQSGAPWQGTAPDAEGGAGRSRAAGFIGRQGDGAGGVGYENEKSPTLRSSVIADVCYQNTGSGWWNEAVVAEAPRTPMRRNYKAATDLVVEADRKYIVRHLTPLECCRLQGYPDGWTENLAITNPSEEDIAFFMKVWSDWAAINGTKPKTRAQVIKWLADPQSDSAEYKAYGNSLAIPCAYDVISRVAKQGEIK